MYLGEIGMYAGTITDDGHPASDAWADFISYFHANAGPMVGYTGWAGGMPDWWNDVHGPHSPSHRRTNYTGDTINMLMIGGDF